jgi:hypothetical protein
MWRGRKEADHKSGGSDLEPDEVAAALAACANRQVRGSTNFSAAAARRKPFV